MPTRKNQKSNKSYKIFRKTRSKNSRGYLNSKRKTLKKIKSNKSNKRFRKSRTKNQKGGDETQEEKDKKLLEAVDKNELDEVEAALAAGANMNVKNIDGWTALIIASTNGHTKIVAMLLEKGADVNAKNNGGWTALHLASQDGYKKIVEMLLEKGADVNAKTNNGWTALKLASQEGHTAIVEMLKKALGIKEENFIVDKFCKCKEATYFDVIDGEITRDIQEYLQEDKDNIMLIYKSNKADTDLEYFGTTRPIITNAFKDKINLFFGCNNADSRFVPSSYNDKITYFKLSKIG